jgi:hypothetical protein
LLGLYSPLLNKLEKAGLVSDILNDRIHSETLKDSVKNAEFVFDEPSQTVLGIVSGSYVGYSNQDFVSDIYSCLSTSKQQSLLSSFGEFEFKKSYSINTHLHIRLLNESKQGTIQGKGGTGDDVSYLGLQVSNSMSGGKALKMAYFVERKVCANGLVLPVGGAEARLIHAGRRENFNRRLSEKMADVVGSLGTVKKTIETLGSIAFNPDKLARNIDLKMLFEVIPNKNLKQDAKESFSDETKNWLSQYKKEDREYLFNVETIKAIPSLIGGEHSNRVFDSHYRDNATMFDLINIFTEEAHKYEPQQRLQIEKNTGELADFIVKNKKIFS